MDPARTSALFAAAALAGAAALWLWRGRARGRTKRIAYRVALLLLAAGLIESARRGGLFARSSPGFALALGGMVLLVVVGQLYGVRFCTACGRMVRNFRPASCPRCAAALPRHGFTEAPRRSPPAGAAGSGDARSADRAVSRPRPPAPN